MLMEKPTNALNVTTAKEAIALVRERKLNHVKVGAFDIDGVLRGKYISREKFESALDSGFGFCDVVLGWDSNDTLYDNTTFTGWHTAYPDANVRLLPETARSRPFEGDMIFMLGEFTGRAEEICPRGVLRRLLERSRAMGYEVAAAVEYEFFVFDETPKSIREKHYQNLQPYTEGNFGYSVLRSSVHSEFYHTLLEAFDKMDIPIEGLHTETGPGVMEAAITVCGALEAADKAALFKTFAKIIAQREGKMATFMAKWSNKFPGQSGHIHLSLTKNGKSAFFDETGEHNMSATMKHFVAGQQRLMPEVLAMVSPTVNSYARMIPGYWAPTSATWGVDNRTTALRVIPGSAKSQRVEYRIAAADGNPYLALAAAIGSGIWGIEQKLQPEPMIEGNAYAASIDASLDLPRTLWDAAQNLKASTAARNLFGDAFVEHFAASREWEEREFRKHITDWELARYFEII
jgi:glutamine synthetase